MFTKLTADLARAALVAAVAFAAAFGPARAAEFTIPATNGTPSSVMVLPPVYNAGPGWAQLPERGTSVVVSAGQIYRIGRRPIVAANAGSITNEAIATTVISTNGTVVSTNTTYAIVAVTVPEVGLSAYDGTVRWMRPHVARERTRLRVTVPGTEAYVSLTDGVGNTRTYTTTTDDDGFADYQGALYGSLVGEYGTGSNATVSVWSW